MHKRNVYLGVFFTAFATLVWEILLTRIFSATMYYHFVFMSISLAMLGFGCSGVIVFLFPKFFIKEKGANHLTIFSSLFSITIFIAIAVYLQINFSPQPDFSTFRRLVFIFFLIFLPYFFSGLVITTALKHYSKNVTVLYCFDLLGAGLGCCFVVGMLFIYDGLSMVIITSFIAALASLLFSRECSLKRIKGLSLLITVFFIAAFICNNYFYRFLKIRYVSGHRETGVIFEKWNPINRVTVLPIKSEAFGGKPSLLIQYDATAVAPIIPFDGDINKVSYLQDFEQSFYYQLRKNADVLIIGVGGGLDVLNAYINGQRKIIGIEINPTIAKLGREIYSDYNGHIFEKPGIQLMVDDGRNFVSHAKEKFDIIHLSNVDSFVASSSGAFTFVENSLYTVEAFKDYYNHLKDNGVLWLARWRTLENYSTETFRVLTGVVQALKESGVDKPEQQIIILESKRKIPWRQSIILLKKTPFLTEEIEAIDNLREKMNLTWLHHPQRRTENELDQYLFASDKGACLRQYPFRVDPPRDDCPFFYNFLKPINYVFTPLAPETPFTYPVFMFKSLFAIIFVLVLFAIFIPLLFCKRNFSNSEPIYYQWGYLFYFACLGLGFMLVEIPLIQKFIIFLGQPIYAIAVILAALLIFSGIGSLLSGRFSEEVTLWRLNNVLLILCFTLVIYIFGLSFVFESFLGVSLFFRFCIAIVLILPLGLLMGMAFPMGIRLLEKDGHAMIPWVWGINGACSVLGSVVAWGLSLNFGYTITLWTATLVYATGYFIIAFKQTYMTTKNREVPRWS